MPNEDSKSERNKKYFERLTIYFIAVLVSIIGFFSSTSFSAISDTNEEQDERLRKVEKDVSLNTQAINSLVELNESKLGNLEDDVNRLEEKIDLLLKNKSNED